MFTLTRFNLLYTLIVLTCVLFNVPDSFGVNTTSCKKEKTIYCGFIRQPGDFISLNGVLYFTANDGNTGVELWRTDGTQVGTVLVKDIQKGTGSSMPSRLTIFDGNLFFSANDGVHGTELWKSDGTSNGTKIVKDIVPGINSSAITHITHYKSNLVISTAGGEIWRSDGTGTGTEFVIDIDAKLSSFIHAEDLLYFVTSEQWGRIFYTDGTVSGTKKVHERTRQNRSVFYSMIELGEYNGEFLFHTKAYHGDVIGFWTIKKDGSLKHLQSFPTGYYDDGPGRPFTKLIQSGNKSYIGIPVNQKKVLLVLDSTRQNDITTLIDRYNLSFVDSFNNGVLVFYAADYKPDRVTLWKSMGTDVGSFHIKEFFSDKAKDATFNTLGKYKNSFYFSLGDKQIWKTDGTQTGTVLIRRFTDEISGDSHIGSGIGGSQLFFSTLNNNGTYDFRALFVNDQIPPYEDAEDFSTSRWNIIDNSPPGAAINNIFDSDIQSQVIQLEGNGKQNGFQLGDRSQKNGAWNNRMQTIISLDVKSNDDFNINISVDTDDGERLLIYQPNDYDLGPHNVHSTHIRYGLGSEYKNGGWHTLKEDLEADLKLFEFKNNIKSINGIVIRGNIFVDNISLLNHPDFIIENAESGNTSNWVIHDFIPTGASISNVFDVNKNSRIIKLESTETKNSFRLGHHHSQVSAWQNTTQKRMHWDMKFAGNFAINITVNTNFGQRFLSYHADNIHRGIRGRRDNQLYLGLSRASKNGFWQTIVRNLETDLQVYEPDNHIITIDGMFVRGNGELDNIKLSN